MPFGKKKKKMPFGTSLEPDGYDFRGRGAGCIPDEEPHDQTAKNIKQSDSVFLMVHIKKKHTKKKENTL